MLWRQRILPIGLTAGLLLVPTPCFAGPGAVALSQFVTDHIIANVLPIFASVAAAALFFYGFRAVFEANSESALSNASTSVIHALVGFAVIALAVPFTMSFLRGIDSMPLLDGLVSVVSFLLTAATGIFALLVTINALRLIAAGGDSGEMEKVRHAITSNVAGLIILFLARTIVITLWERDMDSIIVNIADLVSYILTVIGTVSVIAFMAAGFMLIISIDESLKDRAKRTIIGTLITLAIVMASYTFINFVNVLPS